MSDGAGNSPLIIEGVREDNKKFRPTNWAERVSAVLASFGPDHKLRYSELAHPCVIDGQNCLIVARGLSEKHPEAFKFILEFAHQNKLRIQEDRRVAERKVEIERRTQTPGIETLANEATTAQPIQG